MHRLASEALSAVGLERRGRSRWRNQSDELIWTVRLDRGRSWSPWTAQLAAVVREWSSGDGNDDVHLQQDYCLHGNAVPDSAESYRWNDHRSYFTAAFDHHHDLMPADERPRAFEFMAADVAALFASVRDLAALVAEIRENRLGGFVHHRLREAAERPCAERGPS